VYYVARTVVLKVNKLEKLVFFVEIYGKIIRIILCKIVCIIFRLFEIVVDKIRR